MTLKNFLMLPFKNRLGMSGDNDEVTVLGMGINWGVVACTLAVVVIILTVLLNMTRTVNKTTVGNIQTQNKSITANDDYKKN